MRAFMVSACFVLAGMALGAWTPEKWFDKPQSPRIANYHIQASLDWERKKLEGRETISWRNTGTAATQEIPLHLYLNAFKGPGSLFFREGGGVKGLWRPRDLRDQDSWGYCRLKSVSMNGQFLNGHCGEDETVYWVQLPRPVPPGETIHVDIEWEDQFPRVLARSGWGGETARNSFFLMGAQWFPKIGVYSGDRWHCHPYHAYTEFFADFGVYDVELSLPNALLLAHTGTQTNFKTQEDITKDPQRPLNVIWKLHAEDVHDFAWAVSPSQAWAYKSFVYRGVQVFYYYQVEHKQNLERQRFAIQSALKHAGEWYFPYPYPVLTVVDVPDEARGSDTSGANGMEYPTLITSSSLTFDPFNFRGELEETAIHEFGHQYFYGMLASDEVEEPWLDEGLTSWFTRKTMERVYQSLFASRRLQAGVDSMEVMGYWMDPSLDPISHPGYRMFDYESYMRSAYSKPTLVLDQLEAMLGRPVMEEAMAAYTKEMAFKHPTADDFKRILERVSGRNLSDFWRDFVDGTEVLDVVIQNVDNTEVLQGGWMENGKEMAFAAPQPMAPWHRGSITLLRRGGLRLPMTLWVRLENKSEQRISWDGQDRWMNYEFDSPVVAAILDPDGNYPMLKDRLHASYTARPTHRGIHYWSQMAWGLLTSVLQGAGIG